MSKMSFAERISKAVDCVTKAQKHINKRSCGRAATNALDGCLSVIVMYLCASNGHKKHAREIKSLGEKFLFSEITEEGFTEGVKRELGI